MQNARIIVPHQDNEGNSLDEVIESTVLRLCKDFGGATRIDAQGHWVNPEGRLYSEPVAILESAMTPDAKNRQALNSIAQELLQITDQEAVYIQYADGEIEIKGR